MYKLAVILGIGIVVSVALLSQVGTVTEVRKIETEEVIKEVHPEWAVDEDAVKAAQDVIRRKELEAEENRLEGEIEALKAQLDGVQKELGTY